MVNYDPWLPISSDWNQTTDVPNLRSTWRYNGGCEQSYGFSFGLAAAQNQWQRDYAKVCPFFNPITCSMSFSYQRDTLFDYDCEFRKVNNFFFFFFFLFWSTLSKLYFSGCETILCFISPSALCVTEYYSGFIENWYPFVVVFIFVADVENDKVRIPIWPSF